MGKVATCHSDRPHKAYGLCSLCYQRELRKGYAASYYQSNKERIARRVALRAELDPARKKELQRQADARHKLKKFAKIYATSTDKIQAYLAIAYCMICGKHAEAIDHNHDTGELRGRLCHNCNRGLGLFADDPNLLRTAAEYLEMF
jgi:Fe-S oxidoreductase